MDRVLDQGRTLGAMLVHSRWSLALLAVLSSVVKTGIDLHPEWRRFADAAAAWPTSWESSLIKEGDASLLSNIATPFLAGTLGGRSETSYPWVSGGLIAVAIALPVLLGTMSQARRLLIFGLVVGGSVPAVLLGWLGGYDALVVIATAIATLTGGIAWLAVGWALMAISHSTLAAVALILWAPIVVSTRGRAGIPRIAIAAGSVLGGWLIMRTLTDAWGGSTDRLQLLQAIAPTDLLRSYLAAWPLMVFSVLGVGWFLVLAGQTRRSAWGRPMVVVALVGALGLPLIAADETRIAALALLPALLCWARESVPEEVAHRAGRLMLIPALIVPAIVIWMGVPQYPGWPTPF